MFSGRIATWHGIHEQHDDLIAGESVMPSHWHGVILANLMG